MDLEKTGKLLADLRKIKGMTQKDIAEKLGVVPKTVSKWETGHGLPDVALMPRLAEALGISTEMILEGEIKKNPKSNGNISRLKIYVCPHCESVAQGIGDCKITCCGTPVTPLKPQTPDTKHQLNISEIENDFYITFDHEMTKEHYLSFIMYVTFDKILTVKMYPEQDSSIRIPKMHGGRILYYCNKHGLFELRPKKVPARYSFS